LADEARSAGAAHVAWSAGRAPGPTSFLDARRLSRIVEARRPELVHLHSSKAGLSGRLALRGGRPTIFQPHAWSFDAVRGPLRAAALTWERRAARWASTILCVSEAERVRGEEHGVNARWGVIPNGIDLDAWPEVVGGERETARRRLSLAEQPTVVCVGRLCRQKGQDLLLAAWPSVAARVPDAQLILVGDGPQERSLRKRSRDAVRFVGHRSDVSEWLAAANVVALPSRWEGMSIGMLEAMARGRSIVATDVPGVREALDGDAGAIVAPGDMDGLAAEIAARLEDPSIAAAEGHAARLRAERHHDLHLMTGSIAGLYDQVLSSSTGPTPL
jgi:glycosyltransferase involved in cell wall biosynthesis